MTQREVVKQLGWKWRKKLSRYETGESVLSLEDAASLAETLEISVDWLVGLCPHPSGMKPGYVIVQRAAYEAASDGNTLEPSFTIATPFEIPEDPKLVPPSEASAIVPLIESLRRSVGQSPIRDR